MLGELCRGACLDSMPLRPDWRHLRVEYQQRGDVWPPVADDAGLPYQRVLQEQVFDIGRGNVLAAGRDDQLLLPVDDLHVSVVVDRPDVSGTHPALAVNGFCRPRGVLVVALHHYRAADQDLAVIAELELDPRIRVADCTVLGPVERADGGCARQLSHAPAFGHAEPKRLEELDDARVDGRCPG